MKNQYIHSALGIMLLFGVFSFGGCFKPAVYESMQETNQCVTSSELLDKDILNKDYFDLWMYPKIENLLYQEGFRTSKVYEVALTQQGIGFEFLLVDKTDYLKRQMRVYSCEGNLLGETALYNLSDDVYPRTPVNYNLSVAKTVIFNKGNLTDLY